MIPAMTADEWLSGKNSNPVLMDLLKGVSLGEVTDERPPVRKPMEVETRSFGRTQVAQERSQEPQRTGYITKVESRVVSAPVPPERNETSKAHTQEWYSERNRVSNRAGCEKENDVQYVRATEVSRAPEGTRQNFIQVSARKVSDGQTVSSSRRAKGNQNPDDYRTWDLESVRLS